MPAVEEKNLLIISYYFPPTKTVATLRIFNFHHEAQKHFAEVYALTTSNRQRFPHDDFDFDDSKTTEIPTYDLRRFLSKKNTLLICLHHLWFALEFQLPGNNYCKICFTLPIQY